MMISANQSQLDKMKVRKEILLENILRLESDKESNYSVTRALYYKVLAEVEEAESAVKKKPLQYRRLKRFNMLEEIRVCGVQE